MEGREIDEEMEGGIEEEVEEQEEGKEEGEIDEEQEEGTEGETDEEQGEGAEEGEKDEEQEELMEGETDEEKEEGTGEKDEEQEEGTEGETDEKQGEGTEGRGGVGVGAVKEEGLALSVGARGGREGRGVAGNPPSVAGTLVEPPRRPESARATASGRPVEPRRLAGSPPPLAESPKPAGSVGRAEAEELVEREERFRVVRAARSAILAVLLASEELARSLGLVASEELRRVTLPSRVSSAESLLPSVMVSCWGKREISRALRNEECATTRNYED